LASRPGRFIVGLKNAGDLRPLFLLDEVDKINQSWRGDPTAALLEILDHEQNDHFVDRYLEVPVDLSRAMFICTANYEESIPPALKSRMELIYFREYTKAERLVIATEFLLPKALKDYKLKDYPIIFTPEALDCITDMIPIRQIDKRIKKLLRMAAVEITVHEKDTVTIDKAYVKITDGFYTSTLSKKVGF